MINRVILLLALLIAAANAGIFDSILGSGDQEKQQKKVIRNQKGMGKGKQKTRVAHSPETPVNE